VNEGSNRARERAELGTAPGRKIVRRATSPARAGINGALVEDSAEGPIGTSNGDARSAMSTIDRSRLQVSVGETARRTTPEPTGRQFGAMVARGGTVLVRAAIAAVQHVPGVAIATAAVRGMGLLGPGNIGSDGLASPDGSLEAGAAASVSPTANVSGGVSLSGPVASGAAGSSGGAGNSGGATAGAVGTEGDLLSRGQEMSLRMLRLQEAMSEENRRYTALSNVLHARHEMSKNAINNIR
jgi:hypothetical protein